MTQSESEIRELVRRALLQALGERRPNAPQPPAGMPGAEDSQRASPGTPAAPPPQGSGRGPAVVGEREVLATPAGGELPIAPGAVVTPLARQVALERGVRLVAAEGSPAGLSASGISARPSGATSGKKTVALGADHGGFELKEQIKALVSSEGYEALDCGTNSKESVDYPDFAYAVAKLVSDGKAWRGIVVDGAGIGSCMAANKVPGVRAAMCYDVSTAQNAREHNDANVLTLGGGLIGANLAGQIVKAFLSTAFGGGRHARRVDKIMDIERRFLR